MNYWQKIFYAENAMTVKDKKKNKAMGDDPLMWMKENIGEANTAPSEIQKSRKTHSQVKKGKSQSGKTEKIPDPKSENNRGEQIILDPVLVIDNVKKLYEQFNSVIQKNRKVVVNASAVEMIDTAVLQLLIAFILKLQNQGIKISWIKPSKELISRAELLALKEYLNFD